MASDGKAAAAPNCAVATDLAEEHGMPALFSWADFDGDGRLDLAAVSMGGGFQLLVSTGEGRFEDVTGRVGLAEVAGAALASWADYDGDGRLDLFVGAREGASRLFHNEGGVFIDVSAASGLASEGAVQSAQWFDHDGDGLLDLFVVTAEKSELFRGLAGGFFELTELPLAGAAGAAVLGGTMPGVHGLGSTPAPGSSKEKEKGRLRAGVSVPRTVDGDGTNSSGGSSALGLPPNVGSVTPISLLPSGCANSIRDQANPSTCLTASTTPTLGRLYPLSSNLFVAVGGNVGIGTTTPAARLEVAGTARMTDTLTLAPSGDMALDVNTGSIYKGGALFIHTKGDDNTALGYYALENVTSGYWNTAIGRRALQNTTTGSYNTATGFNSLRSNTSGYWNTASGYGALRSNTVGDSNTASGYRALSSNTTGDKNTATGYGALEDNTTASNNAACGFEALHNNTTGAGNIALGYQAGYNLTTGNDNIAIGNLGVAGEAGRIRMGTAGTHTRTFIAGIRGVTTGVANAIPVLIDSAGQLGTVSSSRRFKEEIRDMGDTTERLLELRPVVFRYKPEVQEGERPLEYGLIAEEVAEVFPDLVVHDEQGQPFTVKYHLLSTMLLNELKGMHERLAALEERLAPPRPAR